MSTPEEELRRQLKLIRDTTLKTTAPAPTPEEEIRRRLEEVRPPTPRPPTEKKTLPMPKPPIDMREELKEVRFTGAPPPTEVKTVGEAQKAEYYYKGAAQELGRSLAQTEAYRDKAVEIMNKLSADPHKYQVRDPETGEYRNVKGADIDRLKADIAKAEEYMARAKKEAEEAKAEAERLRKWSEGEGRQWTVTYEEDGKKKTKTFKSRAAADRFMQEFREKAHKRREAAFTASPEAKKYIEQSTAITRLVKAGAAERQDGKVVLKTPIQNLPDDLYKDARAAGFESPDLPEGPSFKLLEWGQKATKEGSFARSQTEYYSAVLGAGEQAVNNIVGWVQHALTGKRTDWRKVSPETIGYVKDLTPQQKIYLGVGAWSGAFLGSYVATAPIGVATSEVLRGASAIAKATGATTPAALKTIAGEIARHPNLARAVLYGGMVGVEADRVYKDYKEGKLEDVMGEIAMRAAYLGGSVLGFESGVKVDQKLREWWATRGRTLIPPHEIMTQQTLATGDFPSYTEASRQKFSQEFKDLAKRLTAEEYLGKLAPEEYRIWHTTGNEWGVRLNEMTKTRVGTSLNKFPGLFVAPEPSPYFLRLGKPAAYEAGEAARRLGIPGLTGTPEIITLDALVEVMPSDMTKRQLWAWLEKQVGAQTAYIPPVSMIARGEMEAIVPAGSKLVKVGSDWYTNWMGHRIMVNKYALLPEGVALSALPKGAEVVTLGELVSRAPSTVDTYLAFGIIPPSQAYESATMSPEEAALLAETYGLSEAEVRDLFSATSTAMESLTSSLVPTETITPSFGLSDLEDLVEYSGEPTPVELTIPEPTPTVTIPEPEPVPTPTPSPAPAPTPPPRQGGWLPPGFRLKLFHGPKERYRVEFKGRFPKQTLTVEARSYPDAVQKGMRGRPSTRHLPDEVDVTRLGP